MSKKGRILKLYLLKFVSFVVSVVFYNYGINCEQGAVISSICVSNSEKFTSYSAVHAIGTGLLVVAQTFSEICCYESRVDDQDSSDRRKYYG